MLGDHGRTIDQVHLPEDTEIIRDQPSLRTDPALIAEILSPATEKKDRTALLDLYAEQGVAYYLMVAQDTGAVEALTLTDGVNPRPPQATTASR